MKIIGLMLVRNEDWILAYSLRVALSWCDEVVVGVHDSTDNTEGIVDVAAEDYPGRVHKILFDDPVWREMEYRQALLDYGRREGGTHFAIIDADEAITRDLALSPSPHDSTAPMSPVRGFFEALQPREVLRLPMIPVWRGVSQARVDDCVWTRAWLTLGFRDHPSLCWKAAQDGYDFHHREPYNWNGASQPIHRDPFSSEHGFSGVMHYQWAGWRRLLAKQALYKATEVLRWPGREPVAKVNARYNPATDERGARFLQIPSWARWSDYERLIDADAPAWQEEELKSLVAKHGRERFAGLDFFGVA